MSKTSLKSRNTAFAREPYHHPDKSQTNFAANTLHTLTLVQNSKKPANMSKLSELQQPIQHTVPSVIAERMTFNDKFNQISSKMSSNKF